MAIIDLTTTSDTTDRTGAILSAFAAGNDVRLGNGQFHFNPGSEFGLVLTGDHAGRTLYLGDTTSITREAANTNANPVLSSVKNYIYNAIDALNCPGFRLIWENATPGAVDASTGPGINANGAYSGIRLGEAQTVSGLRITQHSYKGVDAFGGNCLVEDYYSASDKGVPLYSGETKTATNDIRPKPLQFDSQSLTKLGPVIVRRIKIGPHPNSTEGLNLKFTSLQSVLIEDVTHVGGSPKAGNGRSLILGENLGRVLCRRFDMPGGISQFPDTEFGSPVVDQLDLHDCLIGGGPGIVITHGFLWQHLLVKRFNLYRCQFSNITEAAFAGISQRDDSSAGLGDDFAEPYYELDKLEAGYMEDCVFRTWRTRKIQNTNEPEVWIMSGSETAIGSRITHANTNRLGPNTGGIKWSNNSTANTDLGNGSLTAGSSSQRLYSFLTAKSTLHDWRLIDHPYSDADTIADSVGAADLSLNK